MNLIKQLLEMADDVIMEKGLDVVLEKIKELRELVIINEGLIGNSRGDLERKFDDLEAKVIKARRDLGRVSSAAATPEDAAELKSIVMKRINFFRKQLHDVMIELGMGDREIDYHLTRIGLDREYGKPAERFTHQHDDPRERSFSNVMNRKRNLEDPDNVKKYVRPHSGIKAWYHKLFK